MDALRTTLADAGAHAILRELDARERQAGAAGDPGAVLADRVALLDGRVFAEFFDTTGEGRPFSRRALAHPLRVRIDLPERAQPDAGVVQCRPRDQPGARDGALPAVSCVARVGGRHRAAVRSAGAVAEN
ncbi:hypothetical protein ACFXA3_15950 [Streptomyces sp. NPDC059456]|uniref:hypothetical protein n=1 Tax=Streptomyces sp. NPDC059456 TaxID=3346838 RepID=UPI0036B9F48D